MAPFATRAFLRVVDFAVFLAVFFRARGALDVFSLSLDGSVLGLDFLGLDFADFLLTAVFFADVDEASTWLVFVVVAFFVVTRFRTVLFFEAFVALDGCVMAADQG
ncbi:MAG: hypothetical protein AAF720_09160 [Pseudomonadota bacterium]